MSEAFDDFPDIPTDAAAAGDLELAHQRLRRDPCHVVHCLPVRLAALVGAAPDPVEADTGPDDTR